MHVDHATTVKKKGSSKVCGWICSVWPSWVWENQHASTGNSVSWSLSHSSRPSFHQRSPEHQELGDLNWSARPSPCCHDNVFLSDLLWAPLGQTSCQSSASSVPREYLCVQFPHWHQTEHLLSLEGHNGPYPWNSLFGQSTLVFWLSYSSDTSHHPSQTPCLPWIS